MMIEGVTAEYLVELLQRRRVDGVKQYWFMSVAAFRHLRNLKNEEGLYVYDATLNSLVRGDFPPLLGLPVKVDKTGTWEGIDVLCEAAQHDSVDHPKHYTSHPSGIECIQVTEHMGFNLGNAVKYIWRADLKADAIEDLRKARWYIDRELKKRGAE